MQNSCDCFPCQQGVCYDFAQQVIGNGVRCGSAEKVYDGLALVCKEYTVTPADELVAGHSDCLISFSSLVDAGSIKNELTIAIYKGTVDKSHNYEITYVPGTMTVTPRYITVTAASAEKLYGGLPLYAPGAIVEPNEMLDALNALVGPNHRFTWEVIRTEGSQTNAGSSPSRIAPDGIVFYFDGKQVSNDNFVITREEGTLTVQPCPLEITVDSAEKVYDGEALEKKFCTITQGVLIEGHYLDERSLRTVGSQTEVGTSANAVSANTVIIRDANGKDVTRNYAISLIEGTLTVLPEDEEAEA